MAENVRVHHKAVVPAFLAEGHSMVFVVVPLFELRLPLVERQHDDTEAALVVTHLEALENDLRASTIRRGTTDFCAETATVSSRTPWILNQRDGTCVQFRSVTKVCRRISLRSASSFRRRRRRTFAASFDTSRLTALIAQPAWVQGGHRWHKSLSAATFNAFGPRSLAAMEMQRHACAEARKQRASRPPGAASVL